MTITLADRVKRLPKNLLLRVQNRHSISSCCTFLLFSERLLCTYLVPRCQDWSRYVRSRDFSVPRVSTIASLLR